MYEWTRERHIRTRFFSFSLLSISTSVCKVPVHLGKEERSKCCLEDFSSVHVRHGGTAIGIFVTLLLLLLNLFFSSFSIFSAVGTSRRRGGVLEALCPFCAASYRRLTAVDHVPIQKKGTFVDISATHERREAVYILFACLSMATDHPCEEKAEETPRMQEKRASGAP